MEKQEFQRLLFKTAFCMMACDGHIDDREVNEIRAMNKSAAYFQGIDLTEELNDLLKSLKEKGKHIIDDLFNNLSNSKLTTVEELLILEVSFRIIYSDIKVDENEIKFLKYLRSKLNVFDETIRQRFGNVEYLYGKDYSKNIETDNIGSKFVPSSVIPEYIDLQNIDFSAFKVS